MGYLPEAMRNYLARLGWGHGDDEIFSDAQAIAWFDVADVVRAPARLDWAKLNHINNHYIRLADDRRLALLTLKAHRERELPLAPDALARLEAAIPLVKEGAKTILELADLTLFALKTRPLALDAKTQQVLTDGETHGRMRRLMAHLAGAKAWTTATLLEELKAFAAQEGVGLGKIGPALRGILSGGAPAPDLAGALAALGPEESLGRLKDALFNPVKTL
jgi:glutamyl-tRNA synthetase